MRKIIMKLYDECTGTAGDDSDMISATRRSNPLTFPFCADQSGTIVDIVAEDGKPVSLDTPLLVIEP
nr:biotin carboxyl carrier protein of acetyl-CoA carboxylase, chloroplastic-like [Tanacetum cinerariifolium]